MDVGASVRRAGARLAADVMGIEAFAAGHDGPENAAVLVGQGATTAFCQPERSLSASTHREMGSLRMWAVFTTDLAPWVCKALR